MDHRSLCKASNRLISIKVCREGEGNKDIIIDKLTRKDYEVGAKTLFVNSRMDKGKKCLKCPHKTILTLEEQHSKEDFKIQNEVLRFFEESLKREMQMQGMKNTKGLWLIYPSATHTSAEPAAFKSTADDLLFFCTKIDFRLFLRLAGLTCPLFMLLFSPIGGLMIFFLFP